VVDVMSSWRLIACLRPLTHAPGNTLTRVRPPPSERDRSTNTLIVDSARDTHPSSSHSFIIMVVVVGQQTRYRLIEEQQETKRERDHECKHERERERSNGMMHTNQLLERWCLGDLCCCSSCLWPSLSKKRVSEWRFGVINIKDRVRRTETTVVSAPLSRSNPTTDS